MTSSSTTNTVLRCYQLKLAGPLDEEFVRSFCPPGLTLEHEGDTTVLSNILTDQSGIIGLIRHLHNLGCTILTMTGE
jgi:hypothetical protein